MTKTISINQFRVKIYDTRAEMGFCAADEAAAAIRGVLAQKEECNMIFAAAPSQNEMLAALAAQPGIEWNRVNAFHMDEYIGLAPDAPQGFANFLRAAIFTKVPFRSVNCLDGTAASRDPAAECARYSQLLRRFPVDITCMGIGENGHIAFNDPPVADFDDPALVKPVALDEICRNQQVHDGCFATLDDVPTHALTLTVPALMHAAQVFCVVPAATKARAVRDTLSPRIKENEDGEKIIDLSETGLTDEDFTNVSRVYLIGCGSAYHVGMAARYVIEKRVPCEVDLASEFRYRDPILEENGLVVIISQSGETADSLAALRLCRERGVRTLAVVNVVGSSIAREADSVMYTWAGPEIAVATTKAYSTQLAALYLVAVHMAEVRGQITKERREELIAAMLALPDQIERVLSDKERVQWYANKMAACKEVFFIGRGLDYAISLEGSLKLKEISYIHSEAYAAGELKHGTISLIEDGVLVVAVATQPELFEKEVSNMVEVRSRGASLFGLTTYGQYAIEDTVNFTVYVPRTDPLLATSLAVVPLQLLAYYISCAKGLDVDKPRNLAKSVTVE